MDKELMISRITALTNNGILKGKMFKILFCGTTYFVGNLQQDAYSTPVCDYGSNQLHLHQTTLGSFCTDFIEELYIAVMRQVCNDDNLF